MRKGSLIGVVLLLSGLLWPRGAAAQTWRVGLQVGHWRSNELPAELSRLRGSSGSYAAGVAEYRVNLEVAQRAAGYLRDAGVAVDILPATVPVNYRADAFVALHTDGSASARSSGFKVATHWREWEAGAALVAGLRAEYGAASGLAWDGGRITSGMRGYYAFSSGRFDHTIANTTPGAILEMGYLTNPTERRLMTQQPDRLGRGVANGVLRFLRSEPASGWPAPPTLPEFRAFVTTATARIRSGPGTNFPVVRTVSRNRMMTVDEIRGEWIKLTAFHGNQDQRWIHRDSVRLERINDDPPQDS